MNKFQKEFLIILSSFCMTFVVGDVFKTEYASNVITSIFAAITVAIAIGFHFTLKEKLSRMFK